MKYNQIQVEDCRMFYREAGNPEKPTILLLHGFPSSSHMFRELRQQFASAYAIETIIGQYTFGTPEGSVGPDGYSLDYYYVCQPGRAEMQNDLILDYRSNVALYPEFQKYLRTYQPPLLAVWGENDSSFIPAGANAFRRDLPNAEIHFVPSGHFALESHHTEIAKLMIDFLHQVLYLSSIIQI